MYFFVFLKTEFLYVTVLAVLEQIFIEKPGLQLTEIHLRVPPAHRKIYFLTKFYFNSFSQNLCVGYNCILNQNSWTKCIFLTTTTTKVNWV